MALSVPNVDSSLPAGEKRRTAASGFKTSTYTSSLVGLTARPAGRTGVASWYVHLWEGPARG